MTWRIAYSTQARRDLLALDATVARRILQALERLATTEHGDVKRVRGRSQRWRLRVGDWRVFFTYERNEGVLRVLRVRHRREAYR